MLKKWVSGFIAIAFVMSLFTSVSAATTDGVLKLDERMDFGGIERSFDYYVPSTYSGEQEVPLMLSFHGSGSSSQGQQLLTNFVDLAESEGFIAVFPDSTVIGTDGNLLPPGKYSDDYDPNVDLVRRWNIDSPAVDPAMQKLSTIDDVGFTEALIDHFAENYNIDESRVYATGMSWGGFFTNHLGVHLNDRLAGIGAVTGQMALSTPQPMLKNGMPVVYVMGDQDPTVPPTGIPGLTYSVKDALSYWLKVNKKARVGSVTYLPYVEEMIAQPLGLPAVLDDTKIRREAFSKGNIHKPQVVLYTVEGGGHTWPGGPQYLPVSMIGKASQQMNASEMIWNDLKKYSR
jgi:polyhydroxybutyrate depolymerase